MDMYCMIFIAGIKSSVIYTCSKNVTHDYLCRNEYCRDKKMLLEEAILKIVKRKIVQCMNV